MAPLGVAILGAGIFVREEHKPAVDACPDLELKAVYSRSKASVEMLLADTRSSGGSVGIYSDDSKDAGLSALLARDDIAAVIIALPILAQPDAIKASLTAGKHVLSEKPIAADVAAAKELIRWKAANAPKLIWGVAESFRFMEQWSFAGAAVAKLGRVLSFSANVSTLVEPGAKYYETAWRKTPQYQGGFLLDGGVHFVAGIQILLGPKDLLRKVAAFTALNQKHLPPVDTVNAVLRTDSGVVGSYANSFGSTLKASEWRVAAERGTVTVAGGPGTVTVVEDGEETIHMFTDNRSGVKPEVNAFAQAVLAGTPNELQSPELALRDLGVIECMLKSGESAGSTMDITELITI